VIAYFDTSAVIPLIIEEPTSSQCRRLWNDANRIVSVRLLYPEARAAIARANRLGRLTAAQLSAAVDELDDVIQQIDHIELTTALAHTAGELAQAHGLRGYDAVHLAAAQIADDPELVLVTGDHELATAATAIRLAIANPNA
jgi:uncharacterized protein